MRLPIPGFFLLSMLFMLGISVADAETIRRVWAVVEVTGTVDIKDAGNNELRTRPGTPLEAPFTVVSGSDGHAVVARGQDRLTVGPNSRVAVPQPTSTESGVITRINQMLGSVLYHDEHRIKDSFEVDTPYLVSVVKGTTFNIRVTADDTTVALIDGSLFVHTLDMKSELLLKPGQAAIKSRLRKGIILKDQQSLSAPRRGPITVAKDGEAPVSNMTTDKSQDGSLPSQDETSEQAVAMDKSNITNVDRISTDGDVNSITKDSINDLGTKVDGGNLVDLGQNISKVSTNATISTGSLVDLGASVGDVSASTSVGSSSGIDLGASVGNVSTSAGVGGGSLVDLGASVGNASASTGIGGGGVSVGVSVGGNNLVDLGTGVSGSSTTTGLGTTTINTTPTTPATSTSSSTTSQLPILGPLLNKVLPGL
jgi:FecR protein